jgi:hypothetical protein
VANKTKSPTESIQGYFRVVLQENPKLLKKRSNDQLYERWLQDHPGEKEVPVNVRQSLANLKSILRHRRKVRRRLKEAGPAGQANGAHQPTVSFKVSDRGLLQLEGQIDEALAFARHLDAAGLREIIRLLRTARNKVIVRMG